MSNKVIGIDPDVRSDIDPREVDGWAVEKVNRKQFNQALFQSITNHVWGTENQVKVSKDATFYTDVLGNALDALDAAVSIENQDKILIKHDVAQTANLSIDAGGKKFRIEMYQGVTLDMSTFNFSLGGTGDQISGVLDVTGTGVVSVIESSGLRVTTSGGVSVSNSAGDIIINNTVPTALSANIDAKDLSATWISVSTVGVKARSIKLLQPDNVSTVINDVDEVFDKSTDLNSPQLSDTWYELFLGANLAGGIQRRLVPVLEGVTDGTTTNELVISTFNFDIHKVRVGDIAQNPTDGTEAKVTDITNAATGRLLLDADIFVSGESYMINLQSPDFGAGYSFIGNVGRVYNTAGSNFTENTVTFINGTYFGNTISDKQVAKAWVNFNGTGTISIRDSFNVSSITDNAVGDYTVNFITPFSSADYATFVSGYINGQQSLGTRNYLSTLSAGSVRVATINTGGTNFDGDEISVTCFGVQ